MMNWMLFVISVLMQFLGEGVSVGDVDVNINSVVARRDIRTKFWSNPAGFDVERGSVKGVVFKHIRKAGGTTIDKHIKHTLRVPPESGYGWKLDDPLTLSYGWQKRGNMMLKLGNASDHGDGSLRIPRYYMQEYGAMDGRCVINSGHRRRWLFVLALRHPLSRHWSEFWYAGPGRGAVLTRLAKLRTGVTIKIIKDLNSPITSQSQHTDQQQQQYAFTQCSGYYKQATTTSDGAPHFFQFDTIDNRQRQLSAKTFVQAKNTCRLHRQDGTWWLVPPPQTSTHATNKDPHASYCSHAHASSDIVPLEGWTICDPAQVLQQRLDTATATTNKNISVTIIRTMSEFEETVRSVFRKWMQEPRNLDGGTPSHSAMRRGRYYSEFQIRSMLGDCEDNAEENTGPHPEFRKDFLCAQGPAVVDGGCFWNTIHRINASDYERVKMLVSHFDIVLTTERMHDPDVFDALNFALHQFDTEGVPETEIDEMIETKRSTPKLNANKKSSGVEIRQTLGSELMADLTRDNSWDIQLHNYVTASRRVDGLRNDDDYGR